MKNKERAWRNKKREKVEHLKVEAI